MMSKTGRIPICFGLFYACIFLKNASVQGINNDTYDQAIDNGDCGTVPDVDHGKVILNDQTNSSYGSTARVECDEGYVALIEELTCLENGLWEDWESYAKCKTIECALEPNITNGEATLIDGDNTYGSLAIIKCDTGYNTTTHNITCTASGTWEYAECDIIGCGVPQNISHGNITLNNKHNTSTGALANVTCSVGYVSNTSIIECLTSGNWSKNATCRPVDCGSVPYIANGNITLHNSTNSTYGAKAMVSCHSGYNATIENITCLASGVWDNSSMCVQNGSCAIPQSISHGYLTLHNTDNTSVGALANVTCDTGYISNTSIIECLTPGNWSKNATCRPVDCGSAPYIANGNITLHNSTNSTYGAKAMVSCHSGYNATIENITCLASGVWDNSSVCVQNGSCAIPQNISHGYLTLQNNDNTSVGALANVTCDTGYISNTSIIECLTSGNWSKNATCRPVDCGSAPYIANGNITLHNSTNSTYGAKAMVSCHSGYNATIENITCLASGVWDNSSVCVQNGSCAIPRNISHGYLTLQNNDNTSVGALANVTCYTGYVSNTSIIECLTSGNWSKNATCRPVDCGSVPYIANGNITLHNSTSSTYGAKAMVSCHSGYNATIENITCLASGVWDNSSVCVQNGSCAIPQNISHGYLTLQNNDNTSVGALANVTCYIGYVSNTSIIECLTSGNWSKNATCRPVDCGSAPYIANGNITLHNSTNSTYGAKAMVSCHSGYNATIENITCLASGVWDNSSVCVQNGSCAIPQNISHGYLTLHNNDNTSVGALANVTCDIGYISNTSIIECLTSGNWSKNATCRPVDCGSAPYIANGNITLHNSTNSTYGAKAMVSCHSGYNATIENITCLASGVWDNSSVCVQNGSCAIPQNISHGYLTLQNNDNTSVGALANVTCYTGYVSNTSIIECLTSGNWSKNATCRPVDCGSAPYIANGNVTLHNSTNSTYGAKAMVSCHSGYNATIENITCLASGVWDNSSVCVQNENCTVPQNISHGYLTLHNKDNTSVGALANVTCNTGYVSNTSIIECLASGNWSKNVTCRPVDCGSAPYIANGNITLHNSTNSTYGAKAMVSCHSGYNATIENITCLASGVWDNSSVCVQTGCGVPQNISNGYITLHNIHSTTYGTLANVTCNFGYVANTGTIECMTSGKWNKNATCEPVDCGIPQGITHGQVTIYNDNTTFGALVSVNCDGGYESNTSAISCTASGTWNVTASCTLVDCGPLPAISNGMLTLQDEFNTSYWARATVSCDTGYTSNVQVINCTGSGQWITWDQYDTCRPVDCGPVTDMPNLAFVTYNADSTHFQATATITCNDGYIANSSDTITCTASGSWDVTECVPNTCDPNPVIENGDIEVISHEPIVGALALVSCNSGYFSTIIEVECLSTGLWSTAVCSNADCGDDLPNIANGDIVLAVDNVTRYGAIADVICDSGFVYNVPYIECQSNGTWQSDARCERYGLGVVKVEAGQDVSETYHSAYLKCSFLVISDLTYRVTWYYNEYQFHDTGIMSGEEMEAHKLIDDAFIDMFDQLGLPILGARIKCTAFVYDGIGAEEMENKTSAEFVPIELSDTNFIFTRGETIMFSIIMNIPFGCPLSISECCLRFLVNDPYDSHDCYDSTLAVIGSDTSGGKICMNRTSPASFTTITNITITTKNNRYYRLKSAFDPAVNLVAHGNSKSIWNLKLTDLRVNVLDDYRKRYRGCYSFVDPYVLTFDGRYYSFQEIEIIVLFRHTTLPIEVQIITSPCNRDLATCACAVTVRAGGDVFTINHCGGHFVKFISQKDGILRVYRWFTNYYQIVLPTGMIVYAYVMPYFDYTMNVYIIPAQSDFNKSSGLCGNYNGDKDDDTMLRGTNVLSTSEASRGTGWWWWMWPSDYFYPDDFAFSWGLENTRRLEENLLNPDVYNNVSPWPEDQKLCVSRTITGGTLQSSCSADEEATCIGPLTWRWGTLVTSSGRRKRAVEMNIGPENLSAVKIAKRLTKMHAAWVKARDEKNHRILKRQVENTVNVTMDECRNICINALIECNAYSKKDDVSNVSSSDDNVENCARDCMYDGNATWASAHCDAFTQEVKVELDKDIKFSEENQDVVKDITDHGCPGNCNNCGDCVEGRCECYDGYSTDLCLIKLDEAPELEEYGDEGVCDTSTEDSCDLILVVGDGFIEDGWCNVTVYAAYAPGKFGFLTSFIAPYVYDNFNEVYVPTVNPNETVGRRRRDAESEDPVFAWMYGISVSHDGINYGELKYVVVMDTSCQETDATTSESSQVKLKQGSCYIAGTCYNDGTFRTGSICDVCDTSNNVFEWTYVCDPGTAEDDQRLAIIIGSVCGTVVLIAVGVAVGFLLYKKYTRPKLPELPQMQSNVKFWFTRKSSIEPKEMASANSWLVPRRKSTGIGESDDADEWS